MANPAVRALVRDDKSHQLASIIQTGGQLGMQTMNQSVYELYCSGQINYEDAVAHAPDPGEFQRLIQRAPRTSAKRTSVGR